MLRDVYLTTQPGWAIATSRELHNRGINERIPTYHRDSTLVASAIPSLLQTRLLTPAGVYGCILEAQATHGVDSTALFVRRLDPRGLKEAILHWLPLAENAERRQYCVVSEVYGRTSRSRKELGMLVGALIHQAFPRWQQTAADGLRVSCKVDPGTALLGIQLYTNLSQRTANRPGTLRDHLACGLLTLANVQQSDVVVDPLMGTGTILQMALERFHVRSCIGFDVDVEAYQTARDRLKGTGARLFRASFDEWHLADLDQPAKVISNLPFGLKYKRARTDRFAQLLFDKIHPVAVAVLMSREQANEFRAIPGLEVKNVLVLGHPASIVYSPPPRAVKPPAVEEAGSRPY